MPEPPSPHDALLASTIARHFEAANIEGTRVNLGFKGVAIDCHVEGVRAFGSNVAASLYFNISGGELGPSPIFASMSGYGDRPESAIVTGACNWACEFGAVLRAALNGSLESEVQELRTTIDGRPFRVVFAGLDRALTNDDSGDPAERLELTRRRLGGDPMLTPVVLGADVLPVLATSTLLSTFVMESPAQRTVEVKVNGADWVPSSRVFPQDLDEAAGSISLLRELAVLTPEGPPRVPSRQALDRTLAGLALRDQAWNAAGWRGWHAHGGLLGPPLTAEELAEVEGLCGTLSADHRSFLTTLAGSGAGPGYGLIWPRPVGEVLPLAHAGCGVTWVMRLDDTHRGEVWVDAAGSDGSFAPVASSFLGWYHAWLDAAVRDSGPWTQWETSQCATVSVLSQVLESDANSGLLDLSGRLDRGAIALSGGGNYLPAGSTLDPCHGCTALVSQFGLTDDVFVQGVLTT